MATNRGGDAVTDERQRPFHAFVLAVLRGELSEIEQLGFGGMLEHLQPTMLISIAFIKIPDEHQAEVAEAMAEHPAVRMADEDTKVSFHEFMLASLRDELSRGVSSAFGALPFQQGLLLTVAFVEIPRKDQQPVAEEIMLFAARQEVSSEIFRSCIYALVNGFEQEALRNAIDSAEHRGSGLDFEELRSRIGM